MESTLQSTNPTGHALNGKYRHGNVVKKARRYVFTLYNEHLSNNHYYHTYTRALEVVTACKEVAQGMALTDKDREVLLLAAWFVDSGFARIDQEPKCHSINLAEAFMEEYGYQAPKSEQVITCIQSVQGIEPPHTELTKALHDGYRLYLAQDDYAERSELLRAEEERLAGRVIDDEEWTSRCLNDFARHPFYTEFAQLKYGKARIENLLKIEHKQRKLIHSDHNEAQLLTFREIEDAFKLTSRNYVDLVGVADRKAGLLIHISSLMVSIVLAVLFRHLADNPTLIGPTILLLLVCSITIAFAILASRPTRLTDGALIPSDESPLFFGSFDKIDRNFERLSWDTFAGQIEALRSGNKGTLFTLMSGELYQTRRLLSRKFRHLSYAYLTFLIGMFVTILAYIMVALVTT